jgi:hypothetical protein
MYNAHVLQRLLTQPESSYSQYFRIKHLLPPYALYYYALIGLSYGMSLGLANKVIVCVYVIAFVLGFRYLALAIGPAANRSTLFATLLILNWSLGMGFVNFCLSLALSFWALGLWLRFANTGDLIRRLKFLILAVLAMFTHPVPLCFLLGMAALELLVRVVRQSRSSTGWQPRVFADGATLAVASLTLAYVKLFTFSHPFTQTAVQATKAPFAKAVLQNAVGYAEEKGLSFLSGPGLELRLYRIVLLIVLLWSCALAFRQFMRDRGRRAWTPSNHLLILSLIGLAALPFVPHDLNTSHFFADRLLLIVWLLPILAASGYTHQSGRMRAAAVGCVLAAQVLVLHAANAKVRPIAKALASAENASYPGSSGRGKVCLLLEDPRAPDVPPGLSFSPLLWASVDFVRQQDGVVANIPWLDLPIIPLGGTSELPATHLPPGIVEFPSILRSDLQSHASERESVLNMVDSVIINQAFRPPATGVDPLLATQPPFPASAWACQTAAETWLRICVKRPGPAEPGPSLQTEHPSLQ